MSGNYAFDSLLSVVVTIVTSYYMILEMFICPKQIIEIHSLHHIFNDCSKIRKEKTAKHNNSSMRHKYLC